MVLIRIALYSQWKQMAYKLTLSSQYMVHWEKQGRREILQYSFQVFTKTHGTIHLSFY